MREDWNFRIDCPGACYSILSKWIECSIKKLLCNLFNAIRIAQFTFTHGPTEHTHTHRYSSSSRMWFTQYSNVNKQTEWERKIEENPFWHCEQWEDKDDGSASSLRHSSVNFTTVPPVRQFDGKRNVTVGAAAADVQHMKRCVFVCVWFSSKCSSRSTASSYFFEKKNKFKSFKVKMYDGLCCCCHILHIASTTAAAPHSNQLRINQILRYSKRESYFHTFLSLSLFSLLRLLILFLLVFVVLVHLEPFKFVKFGIRLDIWSWLWFNIVLETLRFLADSEHFPFRSFLGWTNFGYLRRTDTNGISQPDCLEPPMISMSFR